MLTAAGADVNLGEQMGDTPLHRAALFGQAELIDVLIEAGADPNVRNRIEGTPLHSAASGSQGAAAIRALLEAGADPTLQDIGGRTPWDAAQENEDLKGAEVLDLLKPGGF